MCKWLSSILFPCNLFNKKNPVFRTFDASSTPIQPSYDPNMRDWKEFNYTYVGGEFEATWMTKIVSQSGEVSYRRDAAGDDGGGGSDTFVAMVGSDNVDTDVWSIDNEQIIFKCMNVRSLIVNGVTLI